MSLKHAACRSLSLAARLLASRDAAPAGLRILTYHSVGTELPADPYGTAMTLERFRGHAAVLAAPPGGLSIAPFGPVSDAAPALAVTFDDGYRDTLTEAAPLLIDRGIPFTVFVPPAHLGDAAGLYLSGAQLRELAAMPGVQVGAHGERHLPLTRMDDAELAGELAGSRRGLEDLLGRAVTAMSYPYGMVDRRVRAAAAAAGFSAAGCSVYGANPPERDPLLLRRTEAVAWDTVDDLRLKLLGHWDWFRLRQGDPA